ncbi:hypothetical protein F3Y22_tig00110386pilonHSYRG00026 [Hibiscus syriacus]|uniref:RNase H type-1 domain-containing protein n=1 Tax=Hibiscus syriacus TaxID=106335 RepID=A0A6A3ARB0_HIBSY|nr:hypothetical protein F3Y22_tig00110386pilonHSYRG00026 [Hibiscus syriacus]
MVGQNGEWKWENFDNQLPHEILLRIAAVKPPNISFQEDSIGWNGQPDKKFTVKAAYNTRLQETRGEDEAIWNLIAKYRGIHRIRTFLWLTGREALLTNSERFKRHLASKARSGICGDAWEDTDHVLRKCINATEIWKSLIKEELLQEFMSMHMKEWILSNIENKKQRGTQAPIRQQERKETRWKPPPKGWLKLNIDGARNIMAGNATCGGVVRNDEGKWITGIFKFIGTCTALEAELWGTLEGLDEVWNQGARKVILETDIGEVKQIL